MLLFTIPLLAPGLYKGGRCFKGGRGQISRQPSEAGAAGGLSLIPRPTFSSYLKPRNI